MYVYIYIYHTLQLVPYLSPHFRNFRPRLRTRRVRDGGHLRDSRSLGGMRHGNPVVRWKLIKKDGE